MCGRAALWMMKMRQTNFLCLALSVVVIFFVVLVSVCNFRFNKKKRKKIAITKDEEATSTLAGFHDCLQSSSNELVNGK